LSEPLAGALLDLGVSSRHLDEPVRGFSFRPGTPLDMRMAGPAARGVPTAADLLNELPEEELADLFWRYGEERRSRRLAAEVVKRRAEAPFRTSDDLVEVLERVYGGRLTVQDKARIFQALRIAVNDELGALERALPALRDALEPGGRPRGPLVPFAGGPACEGRVPRVEPGLHLSSGASGVPLSGSTAGRDADAQAGGSDGGRGGKESAGAQCAAAGVAEGGVMRGQPGVIRVALGFAALLASLSLVI